MRVLVAADRRYSQQNRLIDALDRHKAHTHLVSPEDLTRTIVAGFDIVLVDPGLPYDAGVAICRRIRVYSGIPIIMMSGRSDRYSRINGIRSGADDYLATPCHIDEIMVKIAALTRPRGPWREPGMSKPRRAGDMTVDVNSLTITIGDKISELTEKEFQVLQLIAKENGAVCSQEKIASELWGFPEPHVYHLIHVHVSRLRAKLGLERIRTVRDFGYQLVMPPIATDRPSPADKEKRSQRHLRLLLS